MIINITRIWMITVLHGYLFDHETVVRRKYWEKVPVSIPYSRPC